MRIIKPVFILALWLMSAPVLADKIELAQATRPAPVNNLDLKTEAEQSCELEGW